MGDLYGFAGQEGPRVIVRSILWLCLLGPLFFIGYGFTNWITSLRSDVPSFYFSWERSIPFLAWTIVPYWSVDFFYAASFFLRSTKEELDQHGLRILTAQLVSYAAFLLFPLRYDFARPETSGLYGWLFDRLLSFDRPFNLAPSMHVSLAVILMFRYRSKWVTALMLLACLSTLTTYQHHVIDLPAGAWVGLFSIWLIPQPPSTVRTPSDKLALLYLAGAAIFAFAGWWAWWAAGAWLLVAAIYAVGDPLLFRKGSRVAFWLFAPHRWFAKMNSWAFTRREAMAQEIADGVWLGRAPRRGQWSGAMVDLTAELPVTPRQSEYRNIPMLDLVVPSLEQLRRAVNAVEAMPRPTLVFCALGRSRSAITVAAWLIETRRVSSVDEALQRIRDKRPQVYLHEGHRQRLEEWAKR
jgi:hypothetical protein